MTTKHHLCRVTLELQVGRGPLVCQVSVEMQELLVLQDKLDPLETQGMKEGQVPLVPLESRGEVDQLAPQDPPDRLELKDFQ